MKYVYTLILLSIGISAIAQLIPEDIGYDRNQLEAVGEYIRFCQPDGRTLSPGKYSVPVDEETRMIMYDNSVLEFTVGESGHIDGLLTILSIDTSTGKETIMVKCSVVDGIVAQYEKYMPHTFEHLQEEAYISGDTVFRKSYDDKKRLEKELRYIGNEMIYDRTCFYYSYDNYRIRLNDVASGLYEETYNGILQKRIETKGLPEGVMERSHKYTEEGEPEYVKTVYADGTEKTVRPDGSYRVFRPGKWAGPGYEEELGKIEIYDARGELIESFSELDEPIFRRVN